MVPSAFVVLPALPLTANGKLDRSALPMPTVIRETEAVVAHTEDERRLADIFAEVLRLAQVGIHDNFFELGGDSILAIQIVARARSRRPAVHSPPAFRATNHRRIAGPRMPPLSRLSREQ